MQRTSLVLRWSLDSDGPLDPNGPVGDIAILGSAAQISCHATYLDSWFQALLEGTAQLQKGPGKYALDLIEEPLPLVFESASAGATLRHGDVVVPLSNLAEFRHTLESEARAFLAAFGDGLSSSQSLLSVRNALDAAGERQ